jgi:signal transduction histidine kinase
MPRMLQAALLLAALLLAATGGLLARAVSRSLVEPVAVLAADARRLRDGDLVSAITVSGDRELEELAAALDAARQRLAATLEELAALNRGLEGQVAARTADLDEQLARRRELVRRLLAASEEERRRIGRELHDEISQLLTVVQLSLGRLRENPAELERTLDHLAAAQRELHRVIHDLRPSVLDDLGLASALEWYATHGLESAGLEVSLEVDELPDLPEEVEITVFRIYQEIVTNILKHARAERVAIELYVREDAGGRRLVLAVEDDGVGFAAETRGGGVGLVGMRERAELVGGTLRVDSEPGMGTQVVLEVPLSR